MAIGGPRVLILQRLLLPLCQSGYHRIDYFDEIVSRLRTRRAREQQNECMLRETEINSPEVPEVPELRRRRAASTLALMRLLIFTCSKRKRRRRTSAQHRTVPQGQNDRVVTELCVSLRLVRSGVGPEGEEARADDPHTLATDVPMPALACALTRHDNKNVGYP